MKKTGGKFVFSWLAIVGLLLGLAGPAAGQRPEAAERGQRGERGQRAERGERDPEQMRQQRAQRMQQVLGLDEEEWSVIGPIIEKLQDQRRQTQAGGMVGRVRGEEELSDTARAIRELRQVLAEPEATAEQISEKLASLRTARQQAAEQLQAAQDELRELLTQRQEAQLVMIGLLD